MDIIKVVLFVLLSVFITKVLFENRPSLPPFRIFRWHSSAILLGYLAFIEDYSWFTDHHFSLHTLDIILASLCLVWILPFEWLKKEMAYDGDLWNRHTPTSKAMDAYPDKSGTMNFAGSQGSVNATLHESRATALPRPSPYEVMGVDAVHLFGKAIFIGVILGVVFQFLLLQPS